MSLSKVTTTVGLNIGTIDVGKARLMFWDLGGQEELQSLWDKTVSLCCRDGVNEGIQWMVKCVMRNIHRPPRQKDIT
ncbi:PREDICTED: ADP-ribosylation factor-related protein 1-like [Cyprinodon variegatus]|uniref:ADP-ribosylation factor-related protein 1-like n=1 Tax=Cyprinodon variegatus TaxID=28743 RepID=UPI000742A93A|nr:PREDICTED: ADP-ribosylation factor-related protein 1-like [Cyprinodon variegatus]